MPTFHHVKGRKSVFFAELKRILVIKLHELTTKEN